MLKGNWIHKAGFDLLFVLAPPFACLLLIILFPDYFNQEKEMNYLNWFILVLLIDVSHVYSSLFRTYFDKNAFEQKKDLFISIPLLSFVGGVVLYAIHALLFWRVIAYLAVFHFIRQQYGFMRIYSKNDNQLKWEKWIDNTMIYGLCLYPIIYWHFSDNRVFHWFIDGDFFKFHNPFLLQVFSLLYFLLIGIYLVKEINISLKNKHLNLGKNILILGTGLSWYFGIVYFNGDLIFTLLNVVAHGIPYIALVWIVERKKKSSINPKKVYLYLLIFLAVIIGFAFLEEALWDSLVWREHLELFSTFYVLPEFTSEQALSIIVPLLSVPQISHYVLDAFIWKIKKDDLKWQ
jgi:hypothetical protein